MLTIKRKSRLKKVCFSCPTVLLRRPIAEILSNLPNEKVGLLYPRDLIRGFLKIHFEKFENSNIISYTTINPPIISFEWPIPLNPLFLVKIFKFIKQYDNIHVWVPFYIYNTAIILMKKVFFPNKRLYITMDTFPGLSFKTSKITDMFFKIYYKTIGKIIFSVADKIIIYGASMRRYALKAGIAIEKLKVLPTGINKDIKLKDRDLRKDFSIKKNEKIILYVGLLNERKGVSKIIKIAENLREKPFKFILVGDGPSRKKIEKLINLLGLNEKVILTGFRKDIYNFYNEADLFLLPSVGEGLPGVIMESMLYGVPIVSSNIPGTKDLIKNNYNGFLCNIEDINDFKGKILKLLRDEEIRERFIKNSKEKVKKEYSWVENIKKYKELYD